MFNRIVWLQHPIPRVWKFSWIRIQITKNNGFSLNAGGQSGEEISRGRKEAEVWLGLNQMFWCWIDRGSFSLHKRISKSDLRFSFIFLERQFVSHSRTRTQHTTLWMNENPKERTIWTRPLIDNKNYDFLKRFLPSLRSGNIELNSK